MDGRTLTADIIFNGRFLAAKETGVQRSAAALIRNMDRLIAADPRRAKGHRFALYHPSYTQPSMRLSWMEVHSTGHLPGQLWEQIDLPAAVRGKLLVNLCNLAPLNARGCVTMIHDAQVFEAPHSYGRAFARWYRFAQPRIGAHATRILTVSSYSRDALVRFGVAPAERIAVIPNGADHLLAMTSENTGVTQLGLVPGRYTLALATTQPHKNIAMLLRAFAMPLLSDLKLVLFGSEGHEEFAQMGTLPANVVFAGRLSDGALRGLMEQAACLAFPSRTEGFGLPPLEAMSLGCPVIAAPCGALPETCGDAALYIDPDDIEGWANTVRRLADNPIERSLLAERGRAQSAGYTWAASAGKLLDVLLEVCDG